MIVGIVVGCLAVIAALIVTVVIIRRKKPNNDQTNDEIQVLVQDSDE